MSRSRRGGKKYPTIGSKLRRSEGRARRKGQNRIDPENHPKKERPRDSAYERALWNWLLPLDPPNDGWYSRFLASRR